MVLEITKKDFDAAVPAAREPKGVIFGVMQDSIARNVELIAVDILGTPGTDTVEHGEDSTAIMLRLVVKRLACVSAFVDNMRSMDLVLTSTGFGVVSTQDTTPASKMRVDALEEELRRKVRLLRSDLIQYLFGVNGWADTPQRKICVITLFYHFDMLEKYAGISNPKPEEWDHNVPMMLASDAFLRKHIGQSYMDELLNQQTSGSLSTENFPVAVLCQQFIGAWIAQNQRLRETLYARLINTLETDLKKYPTYAQGEGYRLNHFTPYENHAEDSAFHFVG